MIYDGKTVEEPKAKSLLIFFMFYGTWDYKENTVVKSDKELYIDYIFTPLENQNKGFGIIGSLSSIITRYYKSICYGEDGKKINITPKLMRIDLSPIFEYSKTKTIPLWIFAVTKKTKGHLIAHYHHLNVIRHISYNTIDIRLNPPEHLIQLKSGDCYSRNNLHQIKIRDYYSMLKTLNF